MIDIRLAIRSVMVQSLQHLLIQSDDHDVWPNVEFIAASHRMRLVWHPEAAIHIWNSDTLHIRCTAGHTVLHELQKHLVKAPGLIMGAFRATRNTGPLVGAGSENAELAAGRRRPVEHGCLLRDKLWTRLHHGCALLRIKLRLLRCRHLSVGDSRDEY